MSKIFITGSSDGLGKLAAESLIAQGHEVVLHARSIQRATEAGAKVAGHAEVLIGDLSRISDTRQLAQHANDYGAFDVVIHNAGVYQTSSELIFAVNSLAPYILTCLMHKPKRLIYVSSGMHRSGDPDFDRLSSTKISYSTSKLHNVLLSNVMARHWPDVLSNAVDPGWVPTKMGGAGATGDLQKGYETQVWLATSDEEEATVSGEYFYHKEARACHPAADEKDVQEAYIRMCEKETGITLPHA